MTNCQKFPHWLFLTPKGDRGCKDSSLRKFQWAWSIFLHYGIIEVVHFFKTSIYSNLILVMKLPSFNNSPSVRVRDQLYNARILKTGRSHYNDLSQVSRGLIQNLKISDIRLGLLFCWFFSSLVLPSVIPLIISLSGASKKNHQN